MNDEKLLVRLEEKVSTIEKDIPKLFKKIEEVALGVRNQFVEYVQNLNELVEGRMDNLEFKWRDTAKRHEERMMQMERESAKVSQQVIDIKSNQADMKKRQDEDRIRFERFAGY